LEIAYWDRRLIRAFFSGRWAVAVSGDVSHAFQSVEEGFQTLNKSSMLAIVLLQEFGLSALRGFVKGQ
jgi:hypothetical protein